MPEPRGLLVSSWLPLLNSVVSAPLFINGVLLCSYNKNCIHVNVNENYGAVEQNKPALFFLADLDLIPYTNIGISRSVFWGASSGTWSRSVLLKVTCVWAARVSALYRLWDCWGSHSLGAGLGNRDFNSSSGGFVHPLEIKDLLNLWTTFLKIYKSY